MRSAREKVGSPKYRETPQQAGVELFGVQAAVSERPLPWDRGDSAEGEVVGGGGAAAAAAAVGPRPPPPVAVGPRGGPQSPPQLSELPIS